MLSPKAITKIRRIDIAVQEYFMQNPAVKEIAAKDLMGYFVEKGIFLHDDKKGVPIRDILTWMEDENQVCLLKNVMVIRKGKNRIWYFKQITD